ncbi:MAG: cobaltochelatase subunit CobN [Hyphomicrobiaceae bacterium]|nr:cobaltochelatase subunit CobN [Hyphomicrobiaceae bacterium]
MHLLVRQTVSIDEADQAIDLGQTPGEIVVLSFTDSDLSALAAAWAPLKHDLPSLRLASLQRLRHPMSADLYIDDVVAHARYVIVRLLGGADYWRYGLDQITAVCRRNGIALAVVPGDGRADDRLAAASTVSASDLACIDAWLANGGNTNLSSLLGFVATQLGRRVAWHEPQSVPAAGEYVPAVADASALGGQTHGSDPMHNVAVSNSLNIAFNEAHGPLPPTSSSRRRPGSTQVSESATPAGSRGADATSSFHVEQADAGVDPGLRRDDGMGEVDGVDLSARVAEAIADQHASALGAQTHGSDPMHSALVMFYRSAYLAADTQPIDALAQALRARGLQPCALFVTSLKDPTAAAVVADAIAAHRPRVIINATAFSAQREDGSTILDTANCPVLQVATAGLPREVWSASERGLGAADLAMHVVLPEVDGRIFTRAVSFKAEAAATPELEFAPLVHRAVDDRIAYVADAACAWANLAATPRNDRRIAIVLSDYPGRGGRAGYALGLDTPASLRGIVSALSAAGYATGDLPTSDVDLMQALSTGAATVHVSRADYAAALAAWPTAAREQVQDAWPPADTPAAGADHQNGFGFRILQLGNLVIALQPDRGHASDRKAAYHDTALPPAPAYIALYHWLRHAFRADAMVHLGTHGTLEWLPGKAVALSASCYPELVLGAMPVIYPYIVNDPGEAAQAKRRISAITIGHLSPPLATAGMHGAAAEIGALVDEYGTADGLDRRRSRLLREEILERARATGLAEECGISDVTDPEQALVRLDAWLCDLKELAIRDGLHIFGRSPNADVRARHMADLAGATAASDLLASCGPSEIRALVTALDGKRVAPGPSGALSRGRLDVLPTGRNLTTIDPRSIPTRTAAAIGARAAKEFLRQYQQDHGAWPQRVVLDVWASANMRTGGDDLAHAMQLMGVRPTWDHASARVSGFEVLPLAMLDGPRVDVTLRVSGLFRDVFPEQIRVFQQAVHAVAERDEADAQNPLAAARRAGEDLDRIFSGAPGTYGTGVASRALDGNWDTRADLANTYLQTGAWSFGADLEARSNPQGFRARVGTADALLHTQDDNERDLLEGDGAADYLGGFAAAAESLGGDAQLFHLDTSDPNAPKVRTLQAAVARIVRGRLTNPRWIAGQMRHGYRGAAELAQAVDALFAFAATTNAVRGDQFEAAFDAMLGTPDVLEFMRANNPAAAEALAARFDDAIRRGFWQPRRNSVAAVLAEARGVTP